MDNCKQGLNVVALQFNDGCHEAKGARNNSAQAPRSDRMMKRKIKKNAEIQEPQEVQPNAFEFCSELYRFSNHLAEFNRLYQEACPQLIAERSKYYICTEHSGVGCLDLLFEAFCQFMGMEKLKNLPNDSGERVFCWLGKHKASEVLSMLRPNHHTVNRLPLDIFLKDKQSLALTLQSSMFRRGIGYRAHECQHCDGRRLHHQLLCPHQYAEHSLERCREPGCFDSLLREARSERGIEMIHSGNFCPCFRAKYFVPETRVFSSSFEQNVFIEDIARLAPMSQWIAKPSYLHRGRGVRIFSSVEQLRSFLKVETRQRFMWGQDYIVQRYIRNPMLTNAGQKFDVRMFLLVIVCRFWRVLGFLHPGYVRKVARPYREMSAGDRFDPKEHLPSTRMWQRAVAAAATKAAAASAKDVPDKTQSVSCHSAIPLEGSAFSEIHVQTPETSLLEVAESDVVQQKQSEQHQQSIESTEHLPHSLQSQEASLTQQQQSPSYQQQQQQWIKQQQLPCSPQQQQQQPRQQLSACFQQQRQQQKLQKQKSPSFVQDQKHQQHQNSAMAKGRMSRRKKVAVEPEPYEPVPLTEFFEQSFEADECEEFNYAVRHGCMKGNASNLPLLLGAVRIPGASHLKVPPTSSATQTVVTGTIKSNQIKAKPKKSKSKPAKKSQEREKRSVQAPPSESDLLEPFTFNKEFIRCLRLMASRICQGVFDQVKEKSNCHQLFSLDICIDANGKPWLLEVNPTVITEDVNWNSSTIRQVIPSVLVESLGLAHECTRKSQNFLALRTPSSHERKPSDLVFRQNFLWMYSTPAKCCEMFELKSLKYGVDSMQKNQLASRGIEYLPVDYYPERNRRRKSKKESRQAAEQRGQPEATASNAVATRSSYRFPSPVSSVPLLEEDLAYSRRYARLQPDMVGRQMIVRRMQAGARTRQRESMLNRLAAHLASRKRHSTTVRERILAD